MNRPSPIEDLDAAKKLAVECDHFELQALSVIAAYHLAASNDRIAKACERVVEAIELATRGRA